MSDRWKLSWCRDIPRDVAIRRAEDAAAVPSIMHRDLPAAVEELRERVARLEAVTPPREAATDSLLSVNADGLRTERVTLEITHRRHTAHEWAWPQMTWVDAILGESVRVVDEATDIDRLTAERDEARAECERLRAKIVVMEGQSRMDIEREIAVEEAWERCSIVPHWPDDEPGTSQRYAASMEAEIVRLRARVADLDGAKAANAGGEKQEPVAESATTPPEPRGWLTSEDHRAVAFAAKAMRGHAITGNLKEISDQLDALLARSTPPRVRRPVHRSESKTMLGILVDHDNDWIAAIREAGGEVQDG